MDQTAITVRTGLTNFLLKGDTEFLQGRIAEKNHDFSKVRLHMDSPSDLLDVSQAKTLAHNDRQIIVGNIENIERCLTYPSGNQRIKKEILSPEEIDQTIVTAYQLVTTDEDGEKMTYFIVNKELEDKYPIACDYVISPETAYAKALLGKKKGDVIELNDMQIKILDHCLAF